MLIRHLMGSKTIIKYLFQSIADAFISFEHYSFSIHYCSLSAQTTKRKYKFTQHNPCIIFYMTALAKM